MEVFYVIDKPMWQRGLLAILLVVAVGLFYAVSNVEEGRRVRLGRSSSYWTSRPSRRAAPSSRRDRKLPVDPVALEPEPAGDASEAAAADAIALSQTLGERSQSLDRGSHRPDPREIPEDRSPGGEASPASDLTPEARDAIQAELFSLIEREEVEKQAEGLLVARGLSDALVYIANQSAEVIVPDVIDREDAGRIGDLVARVAGVSLDRITIVDGARK